MQQCSVKKEWTHLVTSHATWNLLFCLVIAFNSTLRTLSDHFISLLMPVKEVLNYVFSFEVGCSSWCCTGVIFWIGFRGIKVLQYTVVFRNPKGMIFSAVKYADAPLFVKLICSCCIETIYFSAQHMLPDVCLHRQLSWKRWWLSGEDTVTWERNASAPVTEYCHIKLYPQMTSSNYRKLFVHLHMILFSTLSPLSPLTVAESIIWSLSKKGASCLFIILLAITI